MEDRAIPVLALTYTYILDSVDITQSSFSTKIGRNRITNLKIKLEVGFHNFPDTSASTCSLMVTCILLLVNKLLYKLISND